MDRFHWNRSQTTKFSSSSKFPAEILLQCCPFSLRCSLFFAAQAKFLRTPWRLQAQPLNCRSRLRFAFVIVIGDHSKLEFLIINASILLHCFRSVTSFTLIWQANQIWRSVAETAIGHRRGTNQTILILLEIELSIEQEERQHLTMIAH